MNASAHPLMMAAAVSLAVSMFACLAAVALIRRMRRALLEDDFLADPRPEAEQFPLRAYHGVIQELKQQKHELLSSQQAERRRARTSENVSAAVLSNLSSGVLFLTPAGLVRKANTAARKMLGFASPTGMSVADIFRDSTLDGAFGSRTVAGEAQASLRRQAASPVLEAQYVTPAGDPRRLEITITPVFAPSGEVLGAACLINDKTEMALIRREEELRGEVSAEMALALRTSLATISGYARQLEASRDPALIRRIAADIVSEAAELDHTLGGFLVAGRAAKAAAGA